MRPVVVPADHNLHIELKWCLSHWSITDHFDGIFLTLACITNIAAFLLAVWVVTFIKVQRFSTKYMMYALILFYPTSDHLFLLILTWVSHIILLNYGLNC